MTSRRNFLMNSSLTLAGLFAAKPFKTFATNNSDVNKITILHGTNFTETASKKFIETLKTKNSDVVVINTFDNAVENNYKIVYKGKIKIGIINTPQQSNDVISNINTTALYLKKITKCDLVIVVSTLGYKTADKIDDSNLAAKSANVDVIISNHKKNFCIHPHIALNAKKEEVIINYATSKNFDLGKIAIAFNCKNQKSNVDFLLN